MSHCRIWLLDYVSSISCHQCLHETVAFWTGGCLPNGNETVDGQCWSLQPCCELVVVPKLGASQNSPGRHLILSSRMTMLECQARCFFPGQKMPFLTINKLIMILLYAWACQILSISGLSIISSAVISSGQSHYYPVVMRELRSELSVSRNSRKIILITWGATWSYEQSFPTILIIDTVNTYELYMQYIRCVIILPTIS